MKYALFAVLAADLIAYWLYLIPINSLFGIAAVALIVAGVYAVATERFWRGRRGEW